MISSEPLNYESEDWKLLPPNHMIIISSDCEIQIKPINIPENYLLNSLKDGEICKNLTNCENLPFSMVDLNSYLWKNRYKEEKVINEEQSLLSDYDLHEENKKELKLEKISNSITEKNFEHQITKVNHEDDDIKKNLTKGNKDISNKELKNNPKKFIFSIKYKNVTEKDILNTYNIQLNITIDITWYLILFCCIIFFLIIYNILI